MIRLLVMLVGGFALTGVLTLILVNWRRPDLFRFEPVGRITSPAVLAALDERIAWLHRLLPSALAELPEVGHERTELDGRAALFKTTRTSLVGGGLQIVVTVVVKDPSGLFTRPIGVAARGFRSTAAGGPEQLLDDELIAIAAETDATQLYSGNACSPQQGT